MRSNHLVAITTLKSAVLTDQFPGEHGQHGSYRLPSELLPHSLEAMTAMIDEEIPVAMPTHGTDPSRTSELAI